MNRRSPPLLGHTGEAAEAETARLMERHHGHEQAIITELLSAGHSEEQRAELVGPSARNVSRSNN